MSQVLMEIMEPQIQLIRQEESRKALEELARNIICANRGNHMPDAEIRKLLLSYKIKEDIIEQLLNEK